ncbi:uncharacterized protein LOC128086817 [Tympanuchus pallidicinctus]|uniref:uncharacterized protein LOC128086817 n=1 Tax=Tympanuchus pallidicinctus TaxID=109042 RepID=UPI0022875914|nr:uncharacterized protein LOC128086817 [Tympanuchus pallidicinctus]
MEPSEKQHEDAVAFMLQGKKCSPKKNSVTGWILRNIQKTFQRPTSLQLSSPMAFSQCCRASCPNLIVSGAHEEKHGNVVPVALQHGGTHCSLLPASAGDGCSNNTALWGWWSSLQVQMASCSCALRPSLTSPSPLPCSAGSPSKAKLSSLFSLFSPPSRISEPDYSSLPCAGSKKSSRGSWKKSSHCEEPPGPKSEESAHFPFTGPIIARITEYIYLGNLNAAYSGRELCTNGINSIIDMSSLPSDHSLSIIPCTCGRGGFRHNWSRLRVDIQAFLHGSLHEIRQPCFLVINECIEALMEKGKRVLIHCRDGYSLGPTCVIQYLMVKHSMRLLAAYELVRARYPLKIQECHQDLLVGLEMSLQPGGINVACLKRSLSRKMAWS